MCVLFLFILSHKLHIVFIIYRNALRYVLLTNIFRTKYHLNTYAPFLVLSGVPQGSNLSPLIFYVYNYEHFISYFFIWSFETIDKKIGRKQSLCGLTIDVWVWHIHEIKQFRGYNKRKAFIWFHYSQKIVFLMF